MFSTKCFALILSLALYPLPKIYYCYAEVLVLSQLSAFCSANALSYSGPSFQFQVTNYFVAEGADVQVCVIVNPVSAGGTIVTSSVDVVTEPVSAGAV